MRREVRIDRDTGAEPGAESPLVACADFGRITW
jgi:hypothetical protein